MTHFLFSQFAILDISGRLLWWVLGHEKFCLRLLRLLLKFVPFCERHSFLCIVAVYMLMEERSIHIIILTFQYFITDSKLSHVFNWWFLLAKMEPITKLLDKNLSQLRYEETVTRGCFWPLSCRSAILGYSIMLLERNLWSYPWPSLPSFFTNLNFYKFEQFWSLSMLQSNSCYFCDFCEVCGLLDSGPSLTLFFLGMNVCKIYYSWYWFDVC